MGLEGSPIIGQENTPLLHVRKQSDRQTPGLLGEHAQAHGHGRWSQQIRKLDDGCRR